MKSRKGFLLSDWVEILIVVFAMIGSLLVIFLMFQTNQGTTKSLEASLLQDHIARRHLTTFAQLNNVDTFDSQRNIADILRDVTYGNSLNFPTTTRETISNLASRYFIDSGARVAVHLKNTLTQFDTYIKGNNQYKQCESLGTIQLPSNPEADTFIILEYEQCEEFKKKEESRRSYGSSSLPAEQQYYDPTLPPGMNVPMQ